MNTSTVGVNAIATPDAANTASAMTSTGRLPNRSDRGPRISWPTPMPMRNAVRVSCTLEAGAARSVPICVNDGRYMSTANGPTAVMNPSAASSPGVSRRPAVIRRGIC